MFPNSYRKDVRIVKVIKRIAMLTAAAALVLAGINSPGPTVAADPRETPISPGELIIMKPEGGIAGACPLKHTDVQAEISGFIARVNVVQQFHNPTDEKIEAVYTFPLPQNSAVDYMEMKVGDRTIVGEIHRRELAREIYEAAKEAGHVASLLDQERPNVFTQSVANIMPGEQVTITISYTQLLKYEDGEYQFVFPMVVGPRFIPGQSTGDGGTDEVPDASRINPPITPEGTRAGHDISLAVNINAGVRMYACHSPTHDVDSAFGDVGVGTITLKNNKTIPNKDFVLTARSIEHEVNDLWFGGRDDCLPESSERRRPVRSGAQARPEVRSLLHHVHQVTVGAAQDQHIMVVLWPDAVLERGCHCSMDLFEGGALNVKRCDQVAGRCLVKFEQRLGGLGSLRFSREYLDGTERISKIGLDGRGSTLPDGQELAECRLL